MVLAAGAANLLAADLETWSDLAYTLARTERFEWAATGTFRFTDTIGSLYDRRAGTNLEHQVGGGARARLGYVFRNRNDQYPFRNEHRLVAGINYPLARRTVEVVGTTLYERLFLQLAPDFNRYRQQFDLTRPGKGLSPWLHQDFTFLQGSGFARTRTRFGLQWTGARSAFRAAYQFESISVGTAWVPRHVIYTELSINHPIWDLD